MPVNIPHDLPARRTLMSENVFVMSDERATHQDIRPLRILIVNLMPTKIDTETQLLRLLGNTPLQLQVTFMHMASHESRNTPREHLEAFYTTFEDVRDQTFDGMIITGAPIELLEFEEVTYWDELCQVMDWSATNVFSTLHICWGAQAAMYRHYGIPKFELPSKLTGVFDHRLINPKAKIVSGFDRHFPAPHSRYTGNDPDIIEATDGIELLAFSEEAGVYLAASTDMRFLFVTGHPEYDGDTLRAEYQRDLAKGPSAVMPKHYFPNDDPAAVPRPTWRAHAFLLYANWLNYYVYQRTPFQLEQIPTAVTAPHSTED